MLIQSYNKTKLEIFNFYIVHFTLQFKSGFLKVFFFNMMFPTCEECETIAERQVVVGRHEPEE